MLISLFKLFDFLSIFTWSITYFSLIFFGIKKKICLMPILSLALNLGYELFRVLTIYTSNLLLLIGLYSWLILDFILLIVYFIYGDFLIKRNIVKIISGLFLFILFFIIHLTGYKYINNYTLYSAFSINAIMSIVYLLSLFKLESKNYLAYTIIGIIKCIGTLFASIAYGLIKFNLLILIVGIIIFILDLLSIFIGFIKYKKKFQLNEITN